MSKMPRSRKIGLLWAQFSAYHVDRCEAAAKRFTGADELLCVEVATSSKLYAWEPSRDIAGARKITLFPGQSYESIPVLKRLWRQYVALRKCDVAFFGIAYSDLSILLLALLLRLSGVRVMMMTASKFDDYPRTVWFEMIKGMLVSVFQGAIVGGRRQGEYVRFLGFGGRTVLPGYDSVGLDRVRAEGQCALAPSGTPFAERDFVFVGRFVEKKNLATLIAAYGQYVAMAGGAARRLVLLGSGPLEPAMRAQVAELGLGEKVDFPGFLPAKDVSQVLGRSLALVLVSTEEQWGLVVNEALAFGLPIISSSPVGANDALIRNLLNGYVVDPGCPEAMARAMVAMSAEQGHWERMVAQSHKLAWMGDAERFADAVELMLTPSAEPAATRMRAFLEGMGAQ